MNLVKRDCGIEMRLEVDAGWVDVYMDIYGNKHFFQIGCYGGRNTIFNNSDMFSDFIRVLCRMYPKLETLEVDDPEEYTDKDIEYSNCVEGEDYFPWKGRVYWYEEQNYYSDLTLERIPDKSTDFIIKLHIEQHQDEQGIREYDYEIPYKDLCYATAKACTEILKEHGIFGYHTASYTMDINIRQLLFLKCIAFDNFEANRFCKNPREYFGYTSDFNKEIELLLADM